MNLFSGLQLCHCFAGIAAFATGINIAPTFAAFTPSGINIVPQGLVIQPALVTIFPVGVNVAPQVRLPSFYLIFWPQCNPCQLSSVMHYPSRLYRQSGQKLHCEVFRSKVGPTTDQVLLGSSSKSGEK